MTVFLDLDGVLVDWDTPAAKLAGIDLNDPEIRTSLKNGEHIYDHCPDICNIIEKAGADFWMNLELTPHALQLYNTLAALEEQGIITLAFLTSVGRWSSAASAKLDYIKKNFPNHAGRYVICKDKYLCAHSNALLVDDTKGKLDKFQAAGGRVYQWPKPVKLEDNETNFAVELAALLGIIGYHTTSEATDRRPHLLETCSADNSNQPSV
jgi:hypothetical protein